MDCQLGHEYKDILFTLKSMDSILADDYYHDDSVINERCVSMPLLIEVINNQLLSDNHNAKYLSNYAKQLVNVYFEYKLKLNINYSVLEQNYTELFELFCLPKEEKEWIDVMRLCVLFPNVQEISVKNVNLCTKVMDHILECYERGETGIMTWKLTKMIIKIDEHSKLKVDDAVLQYKQRFNKLNMAITTVHGIGNNDVLLIENDDEMNDQIRDITGMTISMDDAPPSD
eukprot:979189_1